MSRPAGAARGKKAAPPAPDAEVGLAELGLAPGDAVRFRRRDTERWTPAVVARREKDGSIGLHDRRGAARSIAIPRIEVKVQGPRGGIGWEPLAVRAARTEQIPLVRSAPVKRHVPLPDPADTDPVSPEIAAREDFARPDTDVEQLRLL